MDKEEKPEKSKISLTEWGLVIGALAVVDVIQFALDLFFEVGVIVNRFIDIFVGLSLWLYLKLRGKNSTNSKRLVGVLITFIGEEIPDVDALPFWTLDGIYNMVLERADEKINKVIGKIPGGNAVVNKINNKNTAGNTTVNTHSQNLEVARKKNVDSDLNAQNLEVTKRKNVDSDLNAQNLRVAQNKSSVTETKKQNLEMQDDMRMAA